MNKKPDMEKSKALFNILEGIESLELQLEKDREKRLWKDIKIPCSLFDILNGSTKHEMDIIRRSYGFKNISSLKKAELVDELTKLIPLYYNKFLFTLDKEMYGLLKKIVENSGVISNIDIPVHIAELYNNRSLAFSCRVNGKKALYMPDELICAFTKLDGSELQRAIERNTEWIRLVHGMLYYYGVICIWPAIKRIEKYTGQKVDLAVFMDVMTFACDYYKRVCYTESMFQDNRVSNASAILDEHHKRADLDYYPFDKKQLIKASVPEYIENSPNMNRFTGFLKQNYNISDNEIRSTALTVMRLINGKDETEVFDYIHECFQLPSLEIARQLDAILMDLCNNTRQWLIKGHTPNEMLQIMGKKPKPLSAGRIEKRQPKPKAAEVRTRVKIGRNEPCPCGSGKKYKKCCGR